MSYYVKLPQCFLPVDFCEQLDLEVKQLQLLKREWVGSTSVMRHSRKRIFAAKRSVNEFWVFIAL